MSEVSDLRDHAAESLPVQFVCPTRDLSRDVLDVAREWASFVRASLSEGSRLVAQGPQVLGGPLRLGFRLPLQLLPTLLGQRLELLLGFLRHLSRLATGLPRQLLGFIRGGPGYSTNPLLRPAIFAVIIGRHARNLGR
jgi:hypothetical protein